MTDGEDLAARETTELAFPATSGRTGIVIGARQSMVTTFLLYQGLSYLGTHASAWLAALERDRSSRVGGRALQTLLGGIEVQLERDGAWQTVGEVYETGPLATDVHVVLLPEGARAERVRPRLARGGWRIDHVALAAISGEVAPLRVAPSRIRGRVGSEFASGPPPLPPPPPTPPPEPVPQPDEVVPPP